jgi:hypothetical protein
MCEHRECKHSLGPGSHCTECDRLARLVAEQMKKQYRPLYVQRTTTTIQNPFRFRPGQIGGIADTHDTTPHDAFKFITVRAVPDPAHQSSLDYLKGV